VYLCVYMCVSMGCICPKALLGANRAIYIKHIACVYNVGC